MAEVAHARDGQHIVQGSFAVVEDAVTLDRISTSGGIGIQITGTWAGVISFEASIDGTTFVALAMLASDKLAAADLVTSTTAGGAWTAQNNGFAMVRARYSTDTSGTPVVTIKSLPSQF